jgi:hypothetical protein
MLTNIIYQSKHKLQDVNGKISILQLKLNKTKSIIEA